MDTSIVPRRLFRNSASQVLTYVLSWGSKAVIAVAVAHSLGAFGLGMFTITWTVASILSFFAPLGIDTWLIRELNRSRGREDIGSMLGLGLFLGLVFGTSLAVLPALGGVGPELARALGAAAPFVAASPLVLIFRACFHARERMELETATTAVEAVVGLGAAAIVLLSGGGVAGAMIALGGGRVANLGLSVVLARGLWGRLTFVVEARTWLAAVKASLPMGIAYVFTTMVLRFDVLLLGAMSSVADAGLYSAAALIVLTVPMVAMSFVASLYPALSRSGRPADAGLARIFAGASAPLLGTGLCAAAALTVLSVPITTTVFGTRFEAAAPMLSVLAWVLPIRFLNLLCATTLDATYRQKRRTAAVAAGAIVNLFANLLLIPMYGPWGAVWSTILTELTLLALMVWGLRPLRPQALRPLLQGGTIALATASVMSLVPGPLAVRAGTGLVVFAVPATLAWVRPLRRLAGQAA